MDKNKRRGMTSSLFLVSASLPSATSHFVVPALLPNEWLGVGVGQSRGTEVRVGLPSVPSSLENDSVLSERSLDGQLLEGNARSSSLHDPGPGPFSESQSAHLHL